MKNRIVNLTLILIIVLSLFSSCVTNTDVFFQTDVEGAELFIDGQSKGTTPTRVSLSNAIWEEPDITLKKDGYKTVYGSLDKTVQPVNLIAGLIIWWPSLLYCYGPDSTQFYQMIPESK